MKAGFYLNEHFNLEVDMAKSSNETSRKKGKFKEKRKLRYQLTQEQQRLFQQLQEKLNISFKNERLLYQAFTHSSYVNEHRGKTYEDNERLEFLGDAVLELMISQYLYKKFPQMSEGELTKLRASIVCEPALVQFANTCSFGQLVLLGKGEELTGGRTRPSLLADVFEAFIGACYMDQGLDAVSSFLEQVVYPKVNDGAFSHVMDYKSQLQEVVQRENYGTLEYEIIQEKGPAHNREFVAKVGLGERVLGYGYGRSKKDAEQKAAKEALDKVQNGDVEKA